MPRHYLIVVKQKPHDQEINKKMTTKYFRTQSFKYLGTLFGFLKYFTNENKFHSLLPCVFLEHFIINKTVHNIRQV